MAEATGEAAAGAAAAGGTGTGSAAQQAVQHVVCNGHTRPLTELSYSRPASCRVLVSACHDRLPMVRYAENGDWVGTLRGHKGAVWSAKVDAAVQCVATASGDFTAKLWNLTDGAERHTFEHGHIVKSVDLSDGEGEAMRMATGGQEGLLRIFDLGRPDAEPLHVVVQPADDASSNKRIRGSGVTKVLWQNDGSSLVHVGTQAGHVRTFDVRTMDMVREFTSDTTTKGASVMDLERSVDGSTLTVAMDRHVHLLNAGTLEQEQQIAVPMHFREEGGASLTPDKRFLVAGGSDLWVHVFDTVSGEEVSLMRGHHGPVRCVRVAPDGDMCATGSEDGTIRIWSLAALTG